MDMFNYFCISAGVITLCIGFAVDSSETKLVGAIALAIGLIKPFLALIWLLCFGAWILPL